MRRTLGAAAVLLLAAAPAAAQAPVGPEFQANIVTSSSLWRPSVAVDGAGNFVVVWLNLSAQPTDIRARLFDMQGTPRGGELVLANTSVWAAPSVAGDPSGAFVVVWPGVASSQQSLIDVFGRRFSASGVPLGAEFRVNTYTTEGQGEAVVAADASGRFVVAWISQESPARFVKVQRFAGDGSPQGPEFQAQPGTTFAFDSEPALAMDGAGNFVVVWKENENVAGQRFSASGAPMGSTFQVTTSTPVFSYTPSVAAQPDGRFIVAWQVYGENGRLAMARLYDANGAPAGPELVVRHGILSAYGGLATAAERTGGFVVAWPQNDPSLESSSVATQRLSAAGQRLGGPVTINTTQGGLQGEPAMAVNASGLRVAAWKVRLFGGGPNLIRGQRFGVFGAAALAVDTAISGSSNGNGVLQPGETVDVRPTWSNNAAVAQSLAGTFTSISGPPGATHTITDGAGFYDTVPPETSEACTDCYGVAVSGASRPSTHWDAVVREVIDPGDGGHADWLLHVGDSFTDVPPASPFYRFVETVLHRSVTGGCSAATYCPSSPTTRAQMAVFLLVSKEGANYRLGDCAVQQFDDVPISSPFCPWIDELARRGITGGCGGANFCPNDAVTREQMAVFLLRTLEPAPNPPACMTPVFGDVPASSPFCRWVEELVRRGITAGCGGGNYCPGQPVTREQMAVFLTATFGLTLYGP